MKHVVSAIRLPGLAALLATLAAVAASPAVLDLIPKEWSATVIAIAAVVQAMTKPVTRDPAEREAHKAKKAKAKPVKHVRGAKPE